MRNILDYLTGKAKSEGKEVRRAAPAPMHRTARRTPGGRKVWKMLNKQGYEVDTPWGAKQRRKRRALRKVAKAARKVNRAYRKTGGLR